MDDPLDQAILAGEMVEQSAFADTGCASDSFERQSDHATLGDDEFGGVEKGFVIF
jgi:hypothetical protein